MRCEHGAQRASKDRSNSRRHSQHQPAPQPTRPQQPCAHQLRLLKVTLGAVSVPAGLSPGRKPDRCPTGSKRGEVTPGAVRAGQRGQSNPFIGRAVRYKHEAQRAGEDLSSSRQRSQPKPTPQPTQAGAKPGSGTASHTTLREPTTRAPTRRWGQAKLRDSVPHSLMLADYTFLWGHSFAQWPYPPHVLHWSLPDP